MQVPGITSFERRRQRLASGRRFADRMLKAIGLWTIIALVGLGIGMAGYSAFEGYVARRCVRQCGDDSGWHGPNGRTENDGWKNFCRILRDLLGSFAYHRNRLRVGSDLPPHIAPFPRGDP